ncbi:hypothetical protein CMU39_09175 [Elizabethkingia anophelis]|nr:hypothetical protein [Elizabethkingia anophelis]
MSPEVKKFVENYKILIQSRKCKIPTLQDLIKDHNHEIWRCCKSCGHVFDLKVEVDYDKCPKCNEKL